RHGDQGPGHHGPGDRPAPGVRVRRDERRWGPGHRRDERGPAGRPDPDGERGQAPRGPWGRRWAWGGRRAWRGGGGGGGGGGVAGTAGAVGAGTAGTATNRRAAATRAGAPPARPRGPVRR